MKRRPFCRIDRDGCIACGGRVFERRSVISDALASAWGLSARERAEFDEREGQACAACQMSKRVRMLLWSIRKLFPSASSLRVLHCNQVNGLSPWLRTLGQVTETCYRPELALGAKAGELVNEDICQLSFGSHSFDLAIHSETLEHVFDFNQALREVERVLRPGGVQVYTVPLLHGRATRQRMEREADGRVLQLLARSFHGSEGEFPVVWEFGHDFFAQRSTHIVELHYDLYWRNRTVFSVVERKKAVADREPVDSRVFSQPKERE
ncbi:MAG: class I SAM-dependent methyltransferase [Acidimicrobiia bacterium]|nr:class I SAM-dependent methyltransferase [Acidimicrobiia bacterium]